MTTIVVGVMGAPFMGYVMIANVRIVHSLTPCFGVP